MAPGVCPRVVSSRTVIAGWETAIKWGISPMQMSAGTREMVERVRHTHERVDWDPYIQMIDEFRIAVGSAEQMAALMESNLESQPELGRLAAVFVSPRQMYKFLVGTFASAAYSHMSNTIEDLGK